jgi:hypothetical protein
MLNTVMHLSSVVTAMMLAPSAVLKMCETFGSLESSTFGLFL